VKISRLNKLIPPGKNIFPPGKNIFPPGKNFKVVNVFYLAKKISLYFKYSISALYVGFYLIYRLLLEDAQW